MSLCIAAARDKVVKVRKYLMAGKSLEESCVLVGCTRKEYYADLKYLNRNGFSFKVEGGYDE